MFPSFSHMIGYMPFFILVIAGVLMIFFNKPVGADDKNATSAPQKIETAVFAAGCFWCIEKDFEKHDGVIDAVSGYSGGHLDNPTYKDVTGGGTGHLEVIEVRYDPSKLSYKDLLEIFWANVDPLDERGQFCDKGESYKSAIFYGHDEERKLAEHSARLVEQKLGNDIATTIRKAETFYKAEDYHQSYYTKNPNRYAFYRWNCGRDKRLKELWGKDALKRITLF